MPIKIQCRPFQDKEHDLYEIYPDVVVKFELVRAAKIRPNKVQQIEHQPERLVKDMDEYHSNIKKLQSIAKQTITKNIIKNYTINADYRIVYCYGCITNKITEQDQEKHITSYDPQHLMERVLTRIFERLSPENQQLLRYEVQLHYHIHKLTSMVTPKDIAKVIAVPSNYYKSERSISCPVNQLIKLELALTYIKDTFDIENQTVLLKLSPMHMSLRSYISHTPIADWDKQKVNRFQRLSDLISEYDQHIRSEFHVNYPDIQHMFY